MNDLKINELIDIEKIKPEIFFTSDGFESTLARIKADVKSVALDVTTDKGKKEIASLAHKISRSKTAIDELGKDFVSVLKEKSKKVDDARKKIRDELDQLKEETRRPLTDIEEAEKKRIQMLQAEFNALNNKILIDINNLAFCNEEIESATNLVIDDRYGEFQASMIIAKKNYIIKLQRRRDELLKKEQDELEIARLKKEKAESEIKERERIAADNAAKKAREEAEDKARHVIAKAEYEKREAENKLAQIEQQKAKDIKDAENKKLEEEKKIALELKEKEEIEKRRVADTKYQATVNNAAKNAMVAICGFGDETAKIVLTAIIKGKIPNVSIRY